VVGAVLGLGTDAGDTRLGRIDPSVVDRLGIDGVTILAVRPDRYLGFRHDGGDPRAVEDYLEALGA
jgi:hypothetical protein